MEFTTLRERHLKSCARHRYLEILRLFLEAYSGLAKSAFQAANTAGVTPCMIIEDPEFLSVIRF